jgi:hypothetical protein
MRNIPTPDFFRLVLDVAVDGCRMPEMDTKHYVGQEVTLSSSQGPIRRVVVESLGEVLLVCRESEYRNAISAGRQPAVVGFKIKDILNSG